MENHVNRSQVKNTVTAAFGEQTEDAHETGGTFGDDSQKNGISEEKAAEIREVLRKIQQEESERMRQMHEGNAKDRDREYGRKAEKKGFFSRDRNIFGLAWILYLVAAFGTVSGGKNYILNVTWDAEIDVVWDIIFILPLAAFVCMCIAARAERLILKWLTPFIFTGIAPAVPFLIFGEDNPVKIPALLVVTAVGGIMGLLIGSILQSKRLFRGTKNMTAAAYGFYIIVTLADLVWGIGFLSPTGGMGFSILSFYVIFPVISFGCACVIGRTGASAAVCMAPVVFSVFPGLVSAAVFHSMGTEVVVNFSATLFGLLLGAVFRSRM